MAAVTEYHDGGGWVDISSRVPLEGWELREDAEEGSAPTSSIAEADPDLDFEPHGHRPFRVREDTSESDDDILVQGFTWSDDTGRGSPGNEQEYDPLARAITHQINDANAVWQRPVMRGSDCNRPDETDVDRVQWLLGTNEFAIFDDVTTYVHTGSTKNMDANDYRGQTGDQVMRDCAEESGKNWWAKYINNGATRDLVAWYGRDSNSTYDSDLFLSNDPDELSEDTLLDGTSLVWPGQDWKVNRDYSRIYCGIYAQYDGGATYRHNSATHTAYFGDPGPDSHRVLVVPMPNVHTATRAQARADRMLEDIGDPDIHVTGTIRLPAAKATMMRAGMRIPINLTHEPEFTGWPWCRIVNATVTPVAAGAFYDIAIEATPTGGTESSGPPAPQFATNGGVLWEPGATFPGISLQDDITWDGSNDHPGAGYPGPGGPFYNLDTAAFAYLGSPGAYEGYAVVATAGTLDIYLQITWADVAVGSARTYTLRLLLNGTPVATDAEVQGPGFTTGTLLITVSDLAVVAGDELRVDMTVNVDSGTTVPAGVGSTDNRFQILPTSTVTV